MSSRLEGLSQITQSAQVELVYNAAPRLRGCPVDREYDVFERLPDGSVLWRGTVTGLGQARVKLKKLARETSNEVFAMHIFSQQVVARVNATDGQPKTIKHIFQIAYDEKLLSTRARFL